MRGEGDVSERQSSDFQRAVTEAFVRIMRARRPDLVWSARETRKVGKVVSEPDDPNTLSNGTPRAAA